jgi:two-component system sensor kinase FixL
VEVTFLDHAAALKQLTDALPDIFWLSSLDRRQFFYLSRAFERVWRRDPSQFYANPQAFIETIHPDDRHLWQADLAEQLADTSVAEFPHEYRILRPDGEVRWVSSRIVPVRDDRGNVVRIAGISSDITERKAAEAEMRKLNVRLESLVDQRTKELRLSEERLRTITDADPECVMLLDAEGTIWDINRKGLVLIEADSLAEVQGQNILDLVDPHYRATYRAGLAATVQGGVNLQTFEIVGRRGKRRWVEQHSARLTVEGAASGPTQIIAITRDISERIRAEETLRLQAEVLRQTHDAIMVTDLQGRITHWNEAAERDTGYPSRDVLGKPIWFLCPADERPHFQERIARPLMAHGTLVTEARIVRKNGEVYWAHLSLCVFRDRGGRPVGCIGSSIDISERLRAQEQMRAHSEELTHVLRVACLGEMAAGFAHELNQPLMAIASYCERLKLWSARFPQEDVDSLRQTVEKLAEQSVRAGEIIQRLRTLVRKAPGRRVATQVDSLVSQSIALVTPEARLAGVTIEFQTDTVLPKVWVDPIQIEQVLINLLRNAVEAVAAQPAGARLVVVKAEPADATMVRITVTDSGPGVAPDCATKIFGAFYSTKPTGLGMGLAISRSIVEAHRGQLTLDPTVARGASFIVTLPCLQNE